MGNKNRGSKIGPVSATLVDDNTVNVSVVEPELVNDPVVNDDPIVNDVTVNDDEEPDYAGPDYDDEPEPQVIPADVTDADSKAREVSVAGLNIAGLRVQMVPYDRLVADKDFNVRDLKSYQIDEIKDLLANMTLHGQIEPMLACPMDDGSGRYQILRGHRRYTAAGYARADFAALVAAKEARAEDMPFQKLAVRITPPLSKFQKLALLLDHGHQQGLKPSELYSAVVRMRGQGWSVKDIQNHFKVGRGKIQPHINAASLPPDIGEAYAKFLGGAVGVPNMTKEVITDLYAAWNADVKKGGSAIMSEKGKFLPAWNEIKAKGSKKGKARALKDAFAAELAATAGCPDLMNYLQAVSGDEDFVGRLADLRNNAIMALNKMFPPTTIVEGNVTRVV